MKLRSIPPANRRPQHRLSSMRAATASGFIMIGSQSRPSASTERNFRPKVICPDTKVQKRREAYCVALQRLIGQLKDLMANATEPGEIMFWQQQLEKLREANYPG